MALNHRNLSNVAENVQHDLEQHANMVRGHDVVHPDRNDCGGVGGCAMLAAEHDLREAIRDRLEWAARHGVKFTLVAVNRPAS